MKPDELQRLIGLLESLAEDRTPLLELTVDERERLMRAAGRVAHPGRAARRQLIRAQRSQRKQAVDDLKSQDEVELNRTGIRVRQSLAPLTSSRRLGNESPHPEPPRLPPTAEMKDERFIAILRVPRNCYICKRDFERVHFFYDSLCPDCAEFNFEKRNQVADLTGRTALLTGGRVKIGFEAALKLLRCGSQLIVTTRFPRDAAKRFAAQADSSAWIDRLQIFGLDLRHTRSVEAFADHLLQHLSGLDFILNNACQTVRRPTSYYQHLMAAERSDFGALPVAEQALLGSYQELAATHAGQGSDAGALLGASAAQAVASLGTAEQLAGLGHIDGLRRAAELSQIALNSDDRRFGDEVFPQGVYDGDAQQVDLRDENSWRLKLAQISTVEMLEVQLVNAVAPFLLNARLKPLMLRTADRDKHIVNVSAMEGVFYRAFKRDTHPHTNMAKAALNMMTRTSALDYIRDGIHMNSVDTGWITDEDPIEITRRKERELGFRTPLDTVDAAARICDPILTGLNSGEHVWGKFLKDYQVSNW